MINCLADRELDAVYKTRLSEAIHGLGVRNVTWQIALTVAGALGIGAHLAWTTGHVAIFLLVVAGLLLGAQYSIGPLRLKGRGVWQVACLWAVIFFGPMSLVATTVDGSGGPLPWPLLALFACYGAMQQGIILVNTAEDLPEDTEYAIHTTAVALGLRGCLALANAMVGLGGIAVMILAGWLALRNGRNVIATIAPLGVAWAWVTWDIAAVARMARGRGAAEAIALLRPRAKRVPIWITATAWTTLWAAACIGAGVP
jgi:4-hydroxybenzoate polyprenyltransferase